MAGEDGGRLCLKCLRAHPPTGNAERERRQRRILRRLVRQGVVPKRLLREVFR